MARQLACPRCLQVVTLLGSTDRMIAHRCGHGLPCIEAADGRPSCSACAMERGAPEKFEAAQATAPETVYLERLEAGLELARQALERVRTDARSALQDVTSAQHIIGALRRLLIP